MEERIWKKGGEILWEIEKVLGKEISPWARWRMYSGNVVINILYLLRLNLLLVRTLPT